MQLGLHFRFRWLYVNFRERQFGPTSTGPYEKMSTTTSIYLDEGRFANKRVLDPYRNSNGFISLQNEDVMAHWVTLALVRYPSPFTPLNTSMQLVVFDFPRWLKFTRKFLFDTFLWFR
jgi:hypothetical protein